jgi:hypothetical protein
LQADIVALNLALAHAIADRLNRFEPIVVPVQEEVQERPFKKIS